MGPTSTGSFLKASNLPIDIARAFPAIAGLSFSNPIARWWLAAVARTYAGAISIDGLSRQAVAAGGIDTLDRIHLISAPTLVIAGTRDRLVPPSASEEIASRIAGA